MEFDWQGLGGNGGGANCDWIAPGVTIRFSLEMAGLEKFEVSANVCILLFVGVISHGFGGAAMSTIV